MNSRAKGKRGELEFAHWLSERGHEARRGQQFKGGDDSPDVICPSLADCHLEVKRVERGNPYVWLAQAIDEAGDKTPVVAHKRNRKDWIVVMRAEDWLALVEKRDG